MNKTASTTMGTMISSLRKEHGMTQVELAEKMGVTDKAVSKWERDLSYPDVTSLPRLAEIFGISVDELMQVKNLARDSSHSSWEKIQDIIGLIFKAVAVAMGIGVLVLSIFEKIDVYSALKLLGIGLTCAGISLLGNKKQ